jgi:membrane peptidoglycan carboxypeptidase
MGISTWTDPQNYGLSLTLGGGEVKMVDLAQAFAVLANQGVKVPLHPILKVENYKGETLETYNPETSKTALAYLTENDLLSSQDGLERVMDRGPAYMVSNIMQDNSARVQAFGSNSQLVIKDKVVAAKTGTTNDLKDNWTVGFTPDYLVISWVGNNDSTQMSYLASGITGAAPIWHDIMSYVLRNETPLWTDKPADVQRAAVCMTGMPADYGLGEMSNRFRSANYDDTVNTANVSQGDPIASCQNQTQDLYWETGNPSHSGTFRKEYWIRSSTGVPPAFGEEATDLVLEEHSFYYDPVTTLYCADCNRPVDENGKTIYEKQYVYMN